MSRRGTGYGGHALPAKMSAHMMVDGESIHSKDCMGTGVNGHRASPVWLQDWQEPGTWVFWAGKDPVPRAKGSY